MDSFNDYYEFQHDFMDDYKQFENLLQSLLKAHKVCKVQRKLLLGFIYEYFERENDIRVREAESQGEAPKTADSSVLAAMLRAQSAGQRTSEKSSQQVFYYAKLQLFLRLFLNTGKNAELFGELFPVFQQFLRKDNASTQKLALDCIMKFEVPELLRYEKNLAQLLEKQTFRLQLIELNLDSATSAVDAAHRSLVVPVLVSIMYPKLFSQRGLKHKSQVDLTRNVVFSFFQGLREAELRQLIELFFRDHHLPLSLTTLAPSELRPDLLAGVSTQYLGSFLNSLKNMVEKLGTQLYPFLPSLLNATLTVLSLCQSAKRELKTQESQPDSQSPEDASKSLYIFFFFFF